MQKKKLFIKVNDFLKLKLKLNTIFKKERRCDNKSLDKLISVKPLFNATYLILNKYKNITIKKKKNLRI